MGVDMSHIVWVPFDGLGLERNGFYYVELGAGPVRAASLMTAVIRQSQRLNPAKWIGSPFFETSGGFTCAASPRC